MFKNLPNLEKLVLENCHVRDDFPGPAIHLPKVETIFIKDATMDGTSLSFEDCTVIVEGGRDMVQKDSI